MKKVEDESSDRWIILVKGIPPQLNEHLKALQWFSRE